MSETYSSPDPSSRKPADPLPAEPAAPRRVRPAKPYPTFPLYAHPFGQWAKKIRGRFYYFGPWSDPDAALTKYQANRDDLHAGRTPRPDPEALTVKDAVNAFLNEKKDHVVSGELSRRTWDEYKEACDTILAAFTKTRLVSDLRPDDFALLRRQMSKRWGPARLGKMITCVRCVFKFAFDSDLIDRPMRYGPSFKKPSKKTMRLHRARKGLQLFTAEEIRRMVAAADRPLKGMILLGLNAGLGNTDCGRLPLVAFDLETGWLDYPRPKTGIDRRCWLWPETAQAIMEALEQRPVPKKEADAGLVFITKYGNPWNDDSTVTHEMRKLLSKIGIDGHRNFYTLRHTFRTVADESKDQPAVDHIMGHARDDMASVYRERISDERLRAVAEHVRRWLFGTAGQAAARYGIPFAGQA
jgi:integrase